MIQLKMKCFSAEKGNGSYLNNQRMRVSSRSKLKDCIIFTGGPNKIQKKKNCLLLNIKIFHQKFLLP